ncbi:MAG: hypothetical protein H6Q19_1107 [Bacteroidetes bacterium]|nr:hypothetical protein [Bacteroidota bacterium]
MKAILLIINLLLTGIISLNAQNYQTIMSDRIALFNNQNGHIKCIRIDSVENQTDSVFYPFSNIQQKEYDCFLPYSYSWIGRKVIIQSNGYNLFLNKLNDTIKVKTNAVLNENWIAYKYKDSSIVMAKVTGLDTLQFLGQTDSVKTVRFQVYDPKMNPVIDKLNDMSIVLSKNYGFVKVINFSLFPNCEPDYFSGQLETYNLIGLSKPKNGIQNLTWLDVYDFQIGDELHILYESSDWVPNAGNSTTRKTKLKYMEKKIFQDSIVYRVDRETSTLRNVKWDSTSYSMVHDTITETYVADSSFDKLPGEPVVSEYEAYSYIMTYKDHLSKTKPSVYNVIWHSRDSCWSIPVADGCFPEFTYIKGLGGPYYSCSNAFSFGGEDNKLVYYKKGSSTWGTPLVITDVKNIKLDEFITVYPNPASDFIFVRSKLLSPLDFELCDIHGRVIIKNKPVLYESNIDVNSIDNGVYIYRLKLKNEIIKTGKIIKNASR